MTTADQPAPGSRRLQEALEGLKKVDEEGVSDGTDVNVEVDVDPIDDRVPEAAGGDSPVGRNRGKRRIPDTGDRRDDCDRQRLDQGSMANVEWLVARLVHWPAGRKALTYSVEHNGDQCDRNSCFRTLADTQSL